MIILAVLFAITVFLIFCFISVEAYYDDIIDFITNIKPFNAKRKYKKDVKEACATKQFKILVQNERKGIKKQINDNILCCYVTIVFEDNFEWLKKKGFKIIETKKENKYKISWSDTKNDSQS